jgi:hypothetical protein
MIVHGTQSLSAIVAREHRPNAGAGADLRFFLTAYAGGLAFFLAMLL